MKTCNKRAITFILFILLGLVNTYARETLADKNYNSLVNEKKKKKNLSKKLKKISSSELYNKIIFTISNENYEDADDLYNEFYRRFGTNNKLKFLTLAMIDLSLRREEYLLAQHYDELFDRKFATANNIEFRKYLQIKIAFKSIDNTKVKQKSILDLITKIENFKEDYKRSTYRDEVDSMLLQLSLGDYLMNQDTIAYYKLEKKPKAVRIYAKKEKKWIKNVKINKPSGDYFIKKVFR